jgi:hypothetical protein
MPRSLISRTTIRLVAALSLVSALPTPAAAQQVPARRMSAFMRAIQEEAPDSVAAYFPKRGEWTWVQTVRRDRWRVDGKRETPPILSAGTWRFPAAATVAAIDAGGPACESFYRASGEVGPLSGSLSGHMFLRDEQTWRRVGRNRFVPPGAPARSSVFVEWRREGGEWVVSSFGDDLLRDPRLLGTELSSAVRDSVPGQPLPPGPAHASRAAWFVGNKPIRMERFIYVKYGLPRKLADQEIVRVGRVGSIPVFAEAGFDQGTPEVIYVPSVPSEYQPYHGFGRLPCR